MEKTPGVSVFLNGKIVDNSPEKHTPRLLLPLIFLSAILPKGVTDNSVFYHIYPIDYQRIKHQYDRKQDFFRKTRGRKAQNGKYLSSYEDNS